MKLETKLPTTDETFGCWLSSDFKANDVHINVDKNNVVIGHDLDIPHMEFTPSALVLHADGSVAYQYKGKDGSAKTKKLTPAYASRLLLELLLNVDRDNRDED